MNNIIQFNDQNFAQIRSEVRRPGEPFQPWEDPTYPATRASLGTLPPGKEPFPANIVWKRPAVTLLLINYKYRFFFLCSIQFSIVLLSICVYLVLFLKSLLLSSL